MLCNRRWRRARVLEWDSHEIGLSPATYRQRNPGQSYWIWAAASSSANGCTTTYSQGCVMSKWKSVKEVPGMILARRRLPESGGYCLHKSWIHLHLFYVGQSIQPASRPRCKICSYFIFRDSLLIVLSIGLKTQTRFLWLIYDGTLVKLWILMKNRDVQGLPNIHVNTHFSPIKASKLPHPRLLVILGQISCFHGLLAAWLKESP